MLTVVTVYNKKDWLDRILVDALKRQTAQFQFIAIDNSTGKYKSAAAAFNAEVKDPQGDFILFVHQDVDFGTNDRWLEEIEPKLKALEKPGIVGFAGFDFAGKVRGHISSCGVDLGTDSGEPIPVQTLDGFLFAIPTELFKTVHFDEETFDGWHLYSDDYALATQKMGYTTYVIPSYVYHRSFAVNSIGLSKYKRRFYKKYGGTTYTSIGVINNRFYYRSFIDDIVAPVFSFFFPDHIWMLQREARGMQTLLDLECGIVSPMYRVQIPEKVGTDSNPAHTEESRKKGIHQQYFDADPLDLDVPAHSFDLVFNNDSALYSQDKRMELLVERMETWGSKKTLLTVRNGGYLTAAMLKARGYRVYGFGGLSLFRKQNGSLRFLSPFYLSVFIAALSQKIAYFVPSYAFGMVAVKDLA